MGPFDNKILRDDFVKEWRNRGMTEAEISEVYQTADVDKNGMLSVEEWKAFRKIFIVDYDIWDSDMDGMLS